MIKIVCERFDCNSIIENISKYDLNCGSSKEPGIANIITERSAKEKRLRIWKDYVPPALPADVSAKTFPAKVSQRVSFFFPSPFPSLFVLPRICMNLVHFRAFQNVPIRNYSYCYSKKISIPQYSLKLFKYSLGLGDWEYDRLDHSETGEWA